MRKRKMIKPREMTAEEKELCNKIKEQNIKSYQLSKSYTYIRWYDECGKELGFIFGPSGYIIDAVIERYKELAK